MVFLVVGDVNVDASGALDRFPREGEDRPLRSLVWGSGGTAANVATGLARLGAEARLLARVGPDPSAAPALAAARSAGVDTRFVQIDAALSTGFCFAAVSPSGERTFFSHRGANAALGLPDLDDVFHGVHLLQVAGHVLLDDPARATALALVSAARARQIPIAIDLCLPLVEARCADTLALLAEIDVVFANERELGGLVDPGSVDPVADAISLLAQGGVPLVVAKLGDRGSVVHGGGHWVLPSFAVVARDTTGAGDAFVAGFLAAHARGAPPASAAVIGNALGALTATRRGAAEAFPTVAEVRAFLHDHGAAPALPFLEPRPAPETLR